MASNKGIIFLFLEIIISFDSSIYSTSEITEQAILLPVGDISFGINTIVSKTSCFIASLVVISFFLCFPILISFIN